MQSSRNVFYCLSAGLASHLLLIPFICTWLFFAESHTIFQDFSYDVVFGASVLFLAGCVTIGSRFAGAMSLLGAQLSSQILSLVLVWVAGFALLFGKTPTKKAYFPLLFLFLRYTLIRAFYMEDCITKEGLSFLFWPCYYSCLFYFCFRDGNPASRSLRNRQIPVTSHSPYWKVNVPEAALVTNERPPTPIGFAQGRRAIKQMVHVSAGLKPNVRSASSNSIVKEPRSLKEFVPELEC